MQTDCRYCGLVCADVTVKKLGHSFCCFGCATLFEVVQKGRLELEADLNEVSASYKQFDLPEIFNQLVDFQNDKIYKLRIQTPAIHCSSCVFLLEDLPEINAEIVHVRVNFEDQVVTVTAQKSLALSKLATLLDRLGYPPHFDFSKTKSDVESAHNKTLLKQLAVAGFCFGNMMLFSIPHYLGMEVASEAYFSTVFKALNIALSLVVIFYSGRSYLTSAIQATAAWKSHINIPIALGIVAIWMWSIYEILSGGGFGYLDSLAGLVFFLLIGKWFQNKVYRKVSFERSVHDYLPMVVRTVVPSGYEWKRISALEAKDVILVKNNEIIPVGGQVQSGRALVDYSFVSGESVLESIQLGENIYTGGRQLSGNIEIRLNEKPNPDQIWAAWKTQKQVRKDLHWTNKVSKLFTPIVLIISVLTLVLWLWLDASKAIFVFSSVLIVACPCALALSAPFTNGHLLRIFCKNGLYLKSSDQISDLSQITNIVFDKTGTLTTSEKSVISTKINILTRAQSLLVKSLAIQSNHPLSKGIAHSIKGPLLNGLERFKEVPGSGIEAWMNDEHIKIGSAQFVGAEIDHTSTKSPQSFVSINGQIKASYVFNGQYKENLASSLTHLGFNYDLSVLSGDHNGEQEALLKLYPNFVETAFNQAPNDKKEFIQSYQNNRANVLMIGDGINDQNALSESAVGIVVTKNINGFYPSADGVLLDESFAKLPYFMELARYSKKVLKVSLAFSIAYNLIGLSFALAGLLTPVVAAILMPISSITVVLLVTSMVSSKAASTSKEMINYKTINA